MNFWRGKEVAVVGGAGFIGSHVVDLLVREPVSKVVVFNNFLRGKMGNLDGAVATGKVEVVKGDIRDYVQVRDVLTGTDCVFLLAALWLLECETDASAAINTNIIGVHNVIEAASQQKIVFASSASVYGNAVEIPMAERHLLGSDTVYGATKIAGEHFLEVRHLNHGLPFTALRFFNVYGPRQDAKGAYVGVIMKVLDRIDNGKPPLIHGDGEQTYDFTYVEDVARACLKAMEGNASGICNVCTGKGTTINKLVRVLLEVTESNLEPVYCRARKGIPVTLRIGDPSKARECFGFETSVSLQEGLRKLVEWRNANA